MQDILLCDLNAFFASVEPRDHPEYQGKPVVVGGRPGKRGVVSACSCQARAFGVHAAASMAAGVRSAFLPVDMARYRAVSRQVLAAYERFPRVSRRVDGLRRTYGKKALRRAESLPGE